MRVGMLTAAYDATAEEPSFPRMVSFRSVVDWTDFDGKWRIGWLKKA